MRKLFRRFLRWIMADNSNDTQEAKTYPTNGNKSIGAASGASINDRNNGMNFIVYSAIGGKVIQFSTYDQQKDRHNSSLYIVTDKEDLGEEIAQIITRESLSR